MKNLLLAIGSSLISIGLYAAVQSASKPAVQSVDNTSVAFSSKLQPVNLGLPTDVEISAKNYDAHSYNEVSDTEESWNALNFYRAGFHTVVFVSPNLITYVSMPQFHQGDSVSCQVKVFDRALHSQINQDTSRTCLLVGGNFSDSNGNQIWFNQEFTDEEQQIAEYMLRSVGGNFDH